MQDGLSLITEDRQIDRHSREPSAIRAGAIAHEAYNTVVLPDEEKCPHCGAVIRRRVQCKYGDTWQHDCMIGDRISGGPAGNRPGLVSGTRLPEDCPVVRK